MYSFDSTFLQLTNSTSQVHITRKSDWAPPIRTVSTAHTSIGTKLAYRAASRAQSSSSTQLPGHSFQSTQIQQHTASRAHLSGSQPPTLESLGATIRSSIRCGSTAPQVDDSKSTTPRPECPNDTNPSTSRNSQRHDDSTT